MPLRLVDSSSAHSSSGRDCPATNSDDECYPRENAYIADLAARHTGDVLRRAGMRLGGRGPAALVAANDIGAAAASGPGHRRHRRPDPRPPPPPPESPHPPHPPLA